MDDNYCAVINGACTSSSCPEGCVIEMERTKRLYQTALVTIVCPECGTRQKVSVKYRPHEKFLDTEHTCVECGVTLLVTDTAYKDGEVIL